MIPGLGATLAGSTALMLFVLALRAPARRLVGARAAYALWALPAARLIAPTLPAGSVDRLGPAGASLLAAGPRALVDAYAGPAASTLGDILPALWLIGAAAVFAVHTARHIAFCARVRATAVPFGRVSGVSIVEADVEGPLAFGVVHRMIAVPRGFARTYAACEREIALAHERAHHARLDLWANWGSLVVLAAHWWNPVAWIAVRAFREDQEFAADAHVLAGRSPESLPLYARVLAKAAGLGALPACNLHPRSNLKGRLMMISQTEPSRRRRLLGTALLALVGATALAQTVASARTPAATGGQAVTIGVKPDGAGRYALILNGTLVAPGSAHTLPADFRGAGGCDLSPSAKPFAMVIKGAGSTRTYTIMCASAAPATIRATLGEGLVSLKTMRASVATQAASAVFPEAERAHALGAIDRSIREVEAELASA